MSEFQTGLTVGYACLAASADLLDRINVFPVADGDTGTNLRISLAPFRESEKGEADIVQQLARCATGNSGNIAAAFFSEFCRAGDFFQMAEMAARGREKAWKAVGNPLPGTMLTVFDALASSLAALQEQSDIYPALVTDLQQAVRSTTQLLDELKNAAVVDAGALGLYVFFEGFFRNVARYNGEVDSIFDLFAGSLTVAADFQASLCHDYCVDTVIEMTGKAKDGKTDFTEFGDSVVVIRDDSRVKIHLHTPDPDLLQSRLASLGRIVSWTDEAI
ncbi:MAG: DAK2 domain-containing protein, partial [Desulfopila sp.]|nr:DAK2 domain-containing protein [Desulfopila sp.]